MVEGDATEHSVMNCTLLLLSASYRLAPMFPSSRLLRFVLVLLLFVLILSKGGVGARDPRASERRHTYKVVDPEISLEVRQHRYARIWY